MKQLFILFLLSISLVVSAVIPSGYYNTAVGKSDAALKTALYSIISKSYNSSSDPVNVGYDGLYTVYATSDVTSTGKVWDMYSTCLWEVGVKRCSGNLNYSVVCDCYNREHSIPQSWFNEASPMVSDAHHIYPTDGKVNGQRSNYPHGECATGTTLPGGKGKLGNSTFAGYSGTVFEPADEYKGDFARTYFYFTTRYMNTAVTTGGGVFGTTFGDLKSWCVDLYLKWSRQDPVSQKEIDRNNAVYSYQKNRNPFIDHPELAEYIWGNNKGTPWSLTAAVEQVKINFSVSPNPAKQELFVKTDVNNAGYKIFNLNGQLLLGGNLSATNKISTEMLENGMYLLQLSLDNRSSIQRFIVSK